MLLLGSLKSILEIREHIRVTIYINPVNRRQTQQRVVQVLASPLCSETLAVSDSRLRNVIKDRQIQHVHALAL